MDKKTLRAEIRAKKRAMTAQEIGEKSAALAKAFYETAEYKNAKTIYGYLPYNQEVRTTQMLAHALADGKQVAVPKVYGDEMKFILLSDLSQVAKGYAGIPEPIADGPVAADPTALVLMPGLAFDPDGHRLGYGGGFYDKFLAAEPDHPTLALCYDFQMLPHLDTESYDIPVDRVLWAEKCIVHKGEKSDMIVVILVVLVTFGLCWLCDKGFAKVFRNQEQHHTGLAVRLSKRYAVFGLLSAVLGLSAVFAGAGKNTLLLVGGIVLILLGLGLVTYYLSFGIFYDQRSFLYTTFGKRTREYQFRDIVSQQLYNSYGTILIELHMKDGSSVTVQSTTDGVYPFLDAAFAGWLEQTGKTEADCPFHDPANSVWFPPVEVE